MKQIKYSYCLDENNNLIHISSLTDENRRSHTYRCLQCGQDMTPKLSKHKEGSHKSHFAHTADTACDGESYLHKLAKRRIREKFESSESFPMTFTRNIPCQESGKCVCFDKHSCLEQGVSILSDLRKLNGQVIYDTCQEEKKVGDFQPDLLLTCSTKADRKPVFIEVYKTHESEDPKINSGYKIIETTKLKTEADIDSIIEKGFVEGLNCQMFNFSPKLPSIRKKDVPITRFILFGNVAASVIGSTEYEVTCESINRRIHSQSIKELNLQSSGIDIWGNYEEDNILDSYQTGLVYLVKKGMDIRNCILCKHYTYNEWKNTHLCMSYKSLVEKYHYPRQTTARECPKFELNQKLLNHPLSELEKEVSEVPI